MMKSFGRITISVFLTVLLIMTMLGGCAKKTAQEPAEKPVAQSTEEAAEEATEQPAEEDTSDRSSFYFAYGDAKIYLGETFESIKDQLGMETKPSETIKACDPNSDFAITNHFYEGITVCEDNTGIVYTVEVSKWEVPDSDAALNGTVKLGATPDDVKAALGEPENMDEFGLYYTIDKFNLSFYIDEEVNEIIIMSATFRE